MSQYVHAATPPEAELERLRLLEHRYDAATFRRLGELGDLDGARALEVGAGAGSVARWLGLRVGPAGRVLAVDNDPRFLTGTQGPNVDVLCHDVMDPLVQGGFDVAHCRAVLIHLDAPDRALANVVSALRPGGRVLLEDADFVTLVPADERHPGSAVFARIVAATMHAHADLGSFRPEFARGLVPLARRAGLVECRQEATAALRYGGSPEAEFLRRSCGLVLRKLLGEGRVDRADVDVWETVLADPSFCFYDMLSIAVWARRPD